MPNWSSIEIRAAIASSYFVSLSPESRFLLLDLLDTYTERWRFEDLTDAEWDAAAAAISGAADEIMTPVTGGDCTMEFIEENSGLATNYLFANIPQDFDQLVIYCMLRTNRAAATADNIDIRLNDDINANYAWADNRLFPNNTNVAGSVGINDTKIRFNAAATATDSDVGKYTPTTIRLLNYRRQGQEKTVVGDTRRPGNIASGYRTVWQQGYWSVTNADVTQIDIYPDLGTVFAGSSFATLYGIRGAP